MSNQLSLSRYSNIFKLFLLKSEWHSKVKISNKQNENLPKSSYITELLTLTYKNTFIIDRTQCIKAFPFTILFYHVTLLLTYPSVTIFHHYFLMMLSRKMIVRIDFSNNPFFCMKIICRPYQNTYLSYTKYFS